MSDRFQFWAKDGKAVMFMNEAQIKAQEAKDFKDRQAKRARAKARYIGSTPVFLLLLFSSFAVFCVPQS